MKNMVIPAVMAFLAACNPAQQEKTEAAQPAADSAAREIQSPFNITYSSRFAIDEPKNAETVLTLWKDYEEGNLSAHKELFADSVVMYFSDGSSLSAGRDSIIAMGQRHRNTLAKVVDRVEAVTALKSTDKNENWVLIWGMETSTAKNGKVDSVNLQETWRLNKEGKINLLFQYSQATTPPKMK
jgi:hypothetical protein